jgi:hypothetical protein
VAGERDIHGSVLSIREYPFHPHFCPNGWDEIGGPVLHIEGKDISFDQDSSFWHDYLMPDPEPWFAEVMSEVRETVERHSRS